MSEHPKDDSGAKRTPVVEEIEALLYVASVPSNLYCMLSYESVTLGTKYVEHDT